MKRMTAVTLTLALAATLAWSERPALSTVAADVVVLRGATLLTITQGTIEDGTLVLRNGRIAALGKGGTVTIPPGADIVDVRGAWIAPGIIDCHSHLAADTIDTISETGIGVSSMVGIEDVLNPTDITLYRTIAGGVTTTNVLHGSDNAIGGKNAVIKLRVGAARAEDLLFKGAMPGIKFALGENVRHTGDTSGGMRRYPATRQGVEFVIRDALTRARAYAAEWRDYAEARKRGEDVLAPRRDLRLEPLVEVIEGRRLVHAHAYRADEILMLMRLAEEFGFRIATFQHALEAYKVAPEIAAHGAGASIFSDWWGFKVETLDGIPYNAALLKKAGVLVSLNSDLFEYGRRLNIEAAKTVKWGGLTDDEAMELITINPARQLRIDARVGSLEVGKDADVVVWSKHPLSSYALADRVYIDGRLYYERAAEGTRVSAMADEKARLVRAEGRATASAPPPLSTTAPPEDARVSSVMAPDAVEGARISGGSLAIVHARIHPVTGPVTESGSIVIRDGYIVAVGADVATPPDLRLLDAAGADVYPGWINARSTLGLAEPGPPGYADTDEIDDFNPQLHTAVAFHNDSDAIAVTRVNGVTSAAITPSGGLLGGEVAVMSLDGRTWEESVIRRSAGLAFTFPGGALPRVNRPPSETPFMDLIKARDARLGSIAGLLDRARRWAAKASGTAPGAADLVLDALRPVIEGRLPFFVRADREADIRAAVEFADRERIRIVISGGMEAPLVAPLLAARGIPVILGPVLQMPTREDVSHADSYSAAARLHAAGVRFAFATGDANYARLLPFHAARAVAWGLPHEAAIRALTVDAAGILGVGDRLGAIEPGRIADLQLVRGDPLEARTAVLHVVIRGREVPLENRQTELYRRYAGRR